MEKLFGQLVFSVGDKEYNWEDIVLAARVSGAWAELENELRQGLACVRCAEARLIPIPAHDLTAAANDFRYKRNLITAEETEAWLKLWGLTVDEWMGYIRRSLLRRMSADDLPDILSRYQVTSDEIKASIRSEALCSGHLAGFARNLAGRVALHEKFKELSKNEMSAERIKTRLKDLTERFDFHDMKSLSRQSLDEKLENLAILETAFEEIAALALTPDSVKSCVAANRIDWIKLAIDYVAFADEHAAREGALCVREDQMTLAEVAADAQQTLRRATLHIEDIDPALRSSFLACAEGELLGPIQWEGHPALCWIIHKTMPDEAEPQIRQKAEQMILDTLIRREINDRVRWHCSLE